MKIICISHDGVRRVAFSLNVGLHLVLPSLLLALCMAGMLYYTQYANSNAITQAKKRLAQQTNVGVADKYSDYKQQETEPIDDSQAYQKDLIELELLARRIGILEAESLRLNAFGARIVKMAKLDPEEFDFNTKPSLGGIPFEEVNTTTGALTTTELMGTLRGLETDLKAQRKRFKQMTDVLHGRILERNASVKRERKKNAKPTGSPVMNGYVSSLYGMRRDPFTGKMRMHQGIDFAAKKGTAVLAIGSGVISFAGRKGAYGNVVEVTHEKGIVSRYAHLSKIVVRVGKRVKKGKKIAEVGSTGRSTGAHLHLEVLSKGKREDPRRYISLSNMK